MLVCNSVQYEVGPLTTVCSPVLIIAAVYVIKTLSAIRSYWHSVHVWKTDVSTVLT